MIFFARTLPRLFKSFFKEYAMQDQPEKQVVASKDVGSMEEVFGENDSMFQGKVGNVEVNRKDADQDSLQKEYPAVPEGENTVTENMKDNAPDEVDPDEGTVEDGVNDHRLAEVPDVAPEDIKYLKNEDNGRVFEVTPEIIGQRHLVPCTKEGKTFKDTRVVFNGMR
jgi:hypothetical protein